MTEPPSTIDLQDVSAQAVGGKAEGLARLMRMGLPVPPGFVIVGASSGLMPADLLQRYRGLSRDGEPAEVAVRSSAIGEDSAAASFAGQYDTVLGVRGEEALVAAVEQCLGSIGNVRAGAYQARQAATAGGGLDEQTSEAAADEMCVVVQSMVDATAAGVLFTADPVSGRRSRPVIDAVEGLGEALVSGHVSPDHYTMSRDGRTVGADLISNAPVLTDAQRAELIGAALDAEDHVGLPLDLEWAIDRDGTVQWLQARPITRLPPDPGELDTPDVDPTHVFTRCNIGEMFPGVCTPLSYSFTAWSIDVGMQRMHQRVGIQPAIRPGFRFIIMSSGHLFLNLSTMSETATHALGSSSEQLALSVCGRPITEYEIRGSDPPPPWRRIANGLRYVRYVFGRGRARADLKKLIADLRFPDADTAEGMWIGIDERFTAIFDAMDYHLVSSAVSGILTPTLLGILAGGEAPTDANHAEAARLLAAAGDVESADIVAGAERLQQAIAAQPDGRASFVDASPEDAHAWLRSDASGEAGRELARYMRRHGHRAIKELELRQAEWSENPTPLIRSIQVPMRHGARPAPRSNGAASDAESTGTKRYAAPMRQLIRMARRAVRYREETKSGLVMVATRFKGAYRRLAELMVAEGLLPDVDALFFLTHEELGRLVRDRDTVLATRAIERRATYEYQDSLSFPDVFQGEPEPLGAEPGGDSEGGEVRGAPVSRGRVVGTARIVRRLEEAESLEPGEILIAPITDVGWTPYFSMIAGLVTDVGSAVSHGAVVAREYGLPAVVNTRNATRVFHTGDRVLLDADSGLVRLANADDTSRDGSATG